MENDLQNKLLHLRLHFDSTVKACEGGLYDRQLFVAIYNNLVDAVKEFYSLDAKSPLIHVGFNDVYDRKFAELKELEISLKKRMMI